jgi:hypothetical protein
VSTDQGTSTWIVLDSTITITSYVATGLTADTVYSFKVEARNTLGYSVASSAILIRAAYVPDQQPTPSTSISGTDVSITWQLPSDGGSSITAYKIEV